MALGVALLGLLAVIAVLAVLWDRSAARIDKARVLEAAAKLDEARERHEELLRQQALSDKEAAAKLADRLWRK